MIDSRGWTPVTFLFVIVVGGCTMPHDIRQVPISESEPFGTTPLEHREPASQEQSTSESGISAAVLLRQEAVEHLDRGNTDVASAKLEHSLRIEPDSVESYFRLAQVRVAQGLFSRAEHLALKALDLLDIQGLNRDPIRNSLEVLLQQIGELLQDAGNR